MKRKQKIEMAKAAKFIKQAVAIEKKQENDLVRQNKYALLRSKLENLYQTVRVEQSNNNYLILWDYPQAPIFSINDSRYEAERKAEALQRALLLDPLPSFKWSDFSPWYKNHADRLNFWKNDERIQSIAMAQSTGCQKIYIIPEDDKDLNYLEQVFPGIQIEQLDSIP